MDIFTTQLTRVVPVRIRPDKLKVKALLKEAATSGVKEDFDHLEDHEYFTLAAKQNQQEQAATYDKKSLRSKPAKKDKEEAGDSTSHSTSEEGDKHLDLYV